MQNLLHTLLESYAAYALLARVWLALIPAALILDGPMEYEGVLDLLGVIVFMLAAVAVLFGSIGLVWGFFKKLQGQRIERVRFFKACMVAAFAAAGFGFAALGMMIYQELNTPVGSFPPEVVVNMCIELFRIVIVIYVADHYMKHFTPKEPV